MRQSRNRKILYARFAPHLCNACNRMRRTAQSAAKAAWSRKYKNNDGQIRPCHIWILGSGCAAIWIRQGFLAYKSMRKWRKNGVSQTRRILETLENQDFLRRAKNYEIRYRNILTDFHNFMYLYKSPQTRMIAAFLEIATSFSKMQTTPRIGFWLDNSNQTPQQTAENILNARKPVWLLHIRGRKISFRYLLS